MANNNSNRYRQALEALFMNYFGGTARKIKKLSNTQMEDRLTRRPTQRAGQFCNRIATGCCRTIGAVENCSETTTGVEFNGGYWLERTVKATSKLMTSVGNLVRFPH